MRLSPFKIFTISIILTILGFFILPKLSVKLNPSASLPSITVNYSWNDASPYTLERDVTSKLEAGFATLKGLEKLDSKSSKGSGYITLSFNKNINLDIVRFETATIIRQLYKQLPEQASYPTLSVNRPDADESSAILSYSIKAPKSTYEIQKTVTSKIQPIINAIQHVDKTEVYGANPQEYLILFDHFKLNTLKLTKQDLVTALQQSVKRENLGSVNYNNNHITLSLQPLNKTTNWHIPVKKINNRIIYLDEITTIKKQEEEAKTHYRINGENAITINIYATKQANTIALAKTVDDNIFSIQKNIPEVYNIVKTYDSTSFLKAELNKIYERSAYTILILLLFILLVSKSVKYLLITLLTLITNISIAFLLYYAFNVELQLYSLAGITISLGLIIDNSIVMIDHIRHLNNKKVFVPILASTLTTAGALSVIYFLDDKYKVNLIDFAIVIIINLSVSLATALFLIPALIQKIKLSNKQEKKWSLKVKQHFYNIYNNIITTLLRYKKTVIIIIVLVFGIPFFMLPEKLESNTAWYEKTYNNTIGSEWYKETLRPYVDIYLGGSFRLFNFYVFDNASYAKNEETKLYVSASMEKGATVEQMNTVFLEVENYIKQFNEIKLFTTNIYSGEYARLEISFKPEFSNSSVPFILKSRLIRKALDFGGMDWNIYGVGKGFNNGSSNGEPTNFSVKAKGYNYDQLNVWADSLKITLEKHPRIQKVLIRENSFWAEEPSFEYRFKVDKQKLALANVSPSKIIDELKQLSLSKQQDLALNIDGKYSPIRFESMASKAFDIWHIKNTPLDSLNKPITLNGIAKITKERADENIYKENQEYIRLVQFQYTGSAKFGSKFLNEQLKLLETKLPLGYTFERANRQWFLNQDKNNNYAFLLVLVLGIIYLICAILFESFKQPFIILSVIPISFIGVFLTFYWFDFNFDQGGLASFVLLSGITVNASIFIINGFNKLKKEQPDKDMILLYLEAFKQKIFPIMLTIVSTILGFIPFVKDGQNEVFWFALGVGTIGGLIFSLIGILFYLPIFTLKKTN